MARSVLVLLALAVCLAVVSLEADAILKGLFDNFTKGLDAKSKGQTPHRATGNGVADSDDDDDVEATTGHEPTGGKTRRKAGQFAKRQVDSSSTQATNGHEEDSAGDRKYKPRRFALTQGGANRGRAHGRTLRNQLRRENMPVDSYLDYEAQSADQGDHKDWDDNSGAVSDEDEDVPSRPIRRPSAPRFERRNTIARPEEVDDDLDSVNDYENQYEDDEDDDEDSHDADDDEESGQAISAKERERRLKYVRTEPTVSTKNHETRRELLSRIKIRKAPDANQRDENNTCPKGDGKSCGITSSKFWGKQWKGVKKATDKGLKVAKKTLKELPGDIEKLVESVNAAWDCRGQIASLQTEVSKAADLVRSEFAKFTVDWSQIMEQALDYLGDKNLDKVKWDDNDELDFRKDALHSLVIGYEFIRFMINWRENMLLAHEGFKLWLDKLELECQKKKFNVYKDLEFSPSEVHSYMLLMAWDQVQFESMEPRFKLEHLMELEDSRTKNYMSRFFRNIVILQEIYFPTIQALENERASVRLPTVDQEDTAEFFEEFRNDVAERKIDDVDILAPNELVEFVAKLTPQLQFNKLVYTKSYLKSLEAQMKAERRRREQELVESGDSDA